MIDLDSTVELIQLGPNQYQGRWASGPVRFREDGGPWRAINTDLVLSGGVYVPADTPYRLEVASDGGRRIYPDRQDLSKYVDFQAPSWLAGLPREIGRNYIRVYGNNWTLTLSASKLGVKLDVIFNSLPSFTRATFPISVTGYNVKQLLSSGRIQKPVLIDAVGTVRELSWAYQGGELRVNLDFSGLVFPVVLDPTFTVAASLDDVTLMTAYSNSDARMWFGEYYGLVHCAARFVNVNIPNASTINTAILTMFCEESKSGTTCNAKVYAENVDNATQIASAVDFNGRTLTTGTAWNAVPAWTAGTAYSTPDISPEIQTVVNRALWVSGYAINIFVKDNASSGNAYRNGSSWDSTTYAPPDLVITWTAPGGAAVQAAYYYRLYGSGRNRG